MPDGEESIRLGAAAIRRHGGQPVKVVGARLADARLHDTLPPSTAVTVSGDGAYDTKKGHTAIAEWDAEAIIPVRKNGKPWKENTLGASVRNETLRATERLGRTIWKK